MQQKDTQHKLTSPVIKFRKANIKQSNIQAKYIEKTWRNIAKEEEIKFRQMQISGKTIKRERKKKKPDLCRPTYLFSLHPNSIENIADSFCSFFYMTNLTKAELPKEEESFMRK